MTQLNDLQARIDARAEQIAQEAYHQFWQKHQAFGKHGNDQGLEGVTTVDLAEHVVEAVAAGSKYVNNIDDITCGAHVHKILNQYGQLLRLAVYHNEKARLESELLEMAEKLNSGYLEE